MNLEDLGEWMLDHPSATRAIGLGLVALSTVSYLQVLRRFADLEHMLAVHASDMAREASEALGG